MGAEWPGAPREHAHAPRQHRPAPGAGRGRRARAVRSAPRLRHDHRTSRRPRTCARRRSASPRCEPARRAASQEALESARGVLQAASARELRSRHTPQLTFVYDRTQRGRGRADRAHRRGHRRLRRSTAVSEPRRRSRRRRGRGRRRCSPRPGERFVVDLHHNPDGDAIGSLLGLARALRAAGRDVVLAHPDAAARAERPGLPAGRRRGDRPRRCRPTWASACWSRSTAPARAAHVGDAGARGRRAWWSTSTTTRTTPASATSTSSTPAASSTAEVVLGVLRRGRAGR